MQGFIIVTKQSFQTNYQLDSEEKDILRLYYDRYKYAKVKGQIDTDGRIYFTFPNSELSTKSEIKGRTVARRLKHLKELNAFESRRMGLGKPNRIYINEEFFYFQKCQNGSSRSAKMADIYNTSDYNTSLSSNVIVSDSSVSSSSNNLDDVTTTPAPTKIIEKNEIVKMIEKANIKVSDKSIKTLDAYIHDYGYEFVEHIVNNCIDLGANSFKYVANTLKTNIQKGNITIELFNKAIQDHANQVKETYQQLTKKQKNKKSSKPLTLEEELKSKGIDLDEFTNQINKFSDKWYEASNKRLSLSDKEKIKIYDVICRYGFDYVATAIDNAQKSTKIFGKHDISFFVKWIDKAYENSWIDYELLYSADVADTSNISDITGTTDTMQQVPVDPDVIWDRLPLEYRQELKNNYLHCYDDALKLGLIRPSEHCYLKAVSEFMIYKD